MKQVLLFTLIESNPVSHQVVLEAIKSHQIHAGVPAPLHFAATTVREIEVWHLSLGSDVIPVPVFDRQPRNGCPNENVRRNFRFVTRGDDPAHVFPSWIPSKITQGVKVYPRCQSEGLARACALQTMAEFENWRPCATQSMRRVRPDRPNFPGDRAPYLAD